MHGLARDEDVEFVGIEDQFAPAAIIERLPEVMNAVFGLLVDVDDGRVVLAAIADQAVAAASLEIDRQGDAATRDVGLFGGHQHVALVQRQHLLLRQQGMAEAEADLRQARAAAHDDGKGARADFEIERADIAGGDLVEFLGAIGDDAGEDVEAAGGAFRIGGGRHALGQRQAFHQRHDVDAAGFQHRAFREVDDMQTQPVELVGDEMAGTGHEAGADAEGLDAEAQVEAGGWIWSASSARSLFSAPLANSASIALSGRIPVVRVMRSPPGPDVPMPGRPETACKPGSRDKTKLPRLTQAGV